MIDSNIHRVAAGRTQNNQELRAEPCDDMHESIYENSAPKKLQNELQGKVTPSSQLGGEKNQYFSLY